MQMEPVVFQINDIPRLIGTSITRPQNDLGAVFGRFTGDIEAHIAFNRFDNAFAAPVLFDYIKTLIIRRFIALPGLQDCALFWVVRDIQTISRRIIDEHHLSSIIRSPFLNHFIGDIGVLGHFESASNRCFAFARSGSDTKYRCQ